MAKRNLNTQNRFLPEGTLRISQADHTWLFRETTGLGLNLDPNFFMTVFLTDSNSLNFCCHAIDCSDFRCSFLRNNRSWVTPLAKSIHWSWEFYQCQSHHAVQSPVLALMLFVSYLNILRLVAYNLKAKSSIQLERFLTRCLPTEVTLKTMFVHASEREYF